MSVFKIKRSQMTLWDLCYFESFITESENEWMNESQQNFVIMCLLADIKRHGKGSSISREWRKLLTQPALSWVLGKWNFLYLVITHDQPNNHFFFQSLLMFNQTTTKIVTVWVCDRQKDGLIKGVINLIQTK